MKKSDFPHSKKFKLLGKIEVYSTNRDFFKVHNLCQDRPILLLTLGIKNLPTPLYS